LNYILGTVRGFQRYFQEIVSNIDENSRFQGY